MIDAIYVIEAPLVSLYINYYGLFSFFIMEYLAFGYEVYGIEILFGYGIYLMALYHVALHCIGIWSYVMNLGFRLYRYSIVYWA